MSENNRKQALIFEGCKVLPNDHGMAPGMVLRIRKSYVYAFSWTTKRNGTDVFNICKVHIL